MDTIDRIFELMKNRGIKAATLTREIGLSNGLTTQWKQKKQKPSIDNLQKIAEYFDVPIGYLLTGEEQKEKPILSDEQSAEIEALVKLYKSAPAEYRKSALDILRLAEGENKD